MNYSEIAGDANADANAPPVRLSDMVAAGMTHIDHGAIASSDLRRANRSACRQAQSIGAGLDLIITGFYTVPEYYTYVDMTRLEQRDLERAACRAMAGVEKIEEGAWDRTRCVWVDDRARAA